MNKYTAIAAIFGAIVLGGCNDAKSPDSVASNVADAQQKAAKNVTDAPPGEG